MAYLLANFKGNDFLLPDCSEVNIRGIKVNITSETCLCWVWGVAHLSLKTTAERHARSQTEARIHHQPPLRENTSSSPLHSQLINSFNCWRFLQLLRSPLRLNFIKMIVCNLDCAICQRDSVEIYTGTNLPINTDYYQLLIMHQSAIWLMKNAYFDKLLCFLLPVRCCKCC